MSKADEGNANEGDANQGIDYAGDNSNEGDNSNIAVENRADEIVINIVDEEDSDDLDIKASIVRKHQITRSGRISCSYDYKYYFLGTAHMQKDMQDSK